MNQRIVAATGSVVQIELANTSKGSGFFVAPDVIATCWHVIRGASQVLVHFDDDRSPQVAAVRKAFRTLDVAFLYCKSVPQTSPLLLRPELPVPTERVYAISSPLGRTETFNSITEGIVSAVRKHVEPPLVQFSAIIYPGSSGCPILTEGGEVIGMAASGAPLPDGVTTAAGLAWALSSVLLRHLLDVEVDSGRAYCPSCGDSSEAEKYCETCGCDRGGRGILYEEGIICCSVCGESTSYDQISCPTCGQDFGLLDEE